MPKSNRSLFALRTLAFAQQGGRCWYCQVRMWNVCPSELPGLDAGCYRHLKATAEHLQARCDGGKDVPQNIVAACARCNHTRHHRKIPPAPAPYKREIAKRIRSGRWHTRDVHVRGLVLLSKPPRP